MYAIVEIAGRQYRVEENKYLIVNRITANEGDNLTFDKVLMISDKGKAKVGEPTIKGAVVSATVEKHGRGEKVVVFKKKRRKGYTVRNGHRQDLTRIKITSIKTKAEKAATTEEN
jgi:large subunit ribosomal protein L21